MLAKLAEPATAVCVSVPISVALPGFVVSASVMPLVNAGVALPNASTAFTTTGGTSTVLIAALLGCVANTSFAVGPGVMSNAFVVTLGSVGAFGVDATSEYALPVFVICTELNVATQATALTE